MQQREPAASCAQVLKPISVCPLQRTEICASQRSAQRRPHPHHRLSDSEPAVFKAVPCGMVQQFADGCPSWEVNHRVGGCDDETNRCTSDLQGGPKQGEAGWMTQASKIAARGHIENTRDGTCCGRSQLHTCVGLALSPWALLTCISKSELPKLSNMSGFVSAANARYPAMPGARQEVRQEGAR